MRRRWIAAFFIFSALGVGSAASEEEIKPIDEDKDGRAETQLFSSKGVQLRAETDKNGDKKVDSWLAFKNGKRSELRVDSDFDGRVDGWVQFDGDGSQKRTAKDSNRDGKPDQFKEFVKGRNLVLREDDRNFDGKVDRRALTEWRPDKKMQSFSNGRMTSIPTPGYVTLWREEDNDFDGMIDVYSEKGSKGNTKVGKPIDSSGKNQSIVE